MSKKYDATCFIKKEKCKNYENLLPKCISNSKYFFLKKIKLINKYKNKFNKLLYLPLFFSAIRFFMTKILD